MCTATETLIEDARFATAQSVLPFLVLFCVAAAEKDQHKILENGAIMSVLLKVLEKASRASIC